MYLEQRVEQLESVTVEHGKQIDMIAAGLATLTTTVNNGFEEMRMRFSRIDERFDEHDARFDRLEARADRIEARLDEHDIRFDRIEAKLAEHDARFDRIELRLDRLEVQVVQIHGVLTELVTLVKNKL
ncbi:hypothetical protein GCM10010967_04770 [Dyadobacter beijingensis]|uniref:Uncharacterized protein n=1 Tax=Dyadobacter beijingensis TaxID=365489 RepID=A0ABQ2HCS2_9BACT|nr:hypothetical protein [Dyadobacter beijingensis]GGM76238.1 hypothetical protein GCM10010967_04770 [Dyadobacter beijingensis]